MLDDTEATPDPAGAPIVVDDHRPAAAAGEHHSLKRIGPYRITGVLGRGGMGVVYAATDDKLGRSVAVKVIAPAARDLAEARARFWREARALAAVDHPGVVQVHRIDETPEGLLYLAMERVEGATLADLMGPRVRAQTEAWPAAAAVELLVQAASALGAAHALGITHRDVKPANLLIEPSGRVRVVDFGLARRLEGGDDRITETGAVLGTPAYMAPEQVEGQGVSPATDIFALGVVGYRLLSGQHPFARESREATALALAGGRYIALAAAAPTVAPTVVAVVESCLARSPGARPADGTALATRLAEALATTPADLAPLAAAAWPEGAAPPPASPRQTPRPGARLGSGPPPSGPSGGLGSGPSLSRDLGAGTWRWMLGSAVAAALAMGAAWWSQAGDPEAVLDAAVASPASTAPAARLPARPVLAVLDFEGEGLAADDRRPAVLSERLRRQLDGAPERLRTLCRATVAAMAGPEGALRAPREALPSRVDVVVTGELRADAQGELVAHLRAERRSDGARLADLTFEVTDDTEEMAIALSGALLEALGIDPLPAPPPLQANDEALAAWLDAERLLEQGDHDGTRSALARALRLAPDLVPARLSELSLLRAERQGPQLQARLAALRDLPMDARDAARLTVWRAMGAERGAEAMAALRALGERWPYDVQAARLEMSLRFTDPSVRDLAEAERVAERILEVAPKEEDAASRLVRALAFRGHADQIKPTLARLGVPLDTDAFTEVRGDVAVMVGEFDEAVAAYDAAVALAGEDIYSLNMAIAARILAGRCEAAASAALARIEHVEAEGRDGNLDWTYSLATQALLCTERFDALEAVLDRWTAHGESGASQSLGLRGRLQVLRGDPPAHITAWIAPALVAPQTPATARPALALTLSRVVTDRVALQAALRQAEDQALDASLPPTVRRGWESARLALSLRGRLLDLLDASDGEAKTRADAEAHRAAVARLVADSAASVPPVARLRDEGELVGRAESLGRHAELLDALDETEAARAAWRLVADAGYGRLWTTDLWLRARARLAGP